MQESTSSSSVTVSPSFTTYSSTRFLDIAARVVDEFKYDEEYGDVFSYDSNFTLPESELHFPVEKDGERSAAVEEEEDEDGCGDAAEEDDSDFEFMVIRREEDSSPISADEIFDNGRIRPMFPIFNTDLVYGYGDRQTESLREADAKPTTATIRLPLKKLLIEERETASCSSSEADDLETVPPGTYCVWTPKHQEMSKKSNSTGSSKRWKFRDLLHRSHSDGKDTFVFLSQPNQGKKTSLIRKKTVTEVESEEKRPSVDAKASSSGRVKAHEAHYLKNRAKKESDRKKSYLPYRQDLVGFFASVNGLSRTLQPF